jgi:hypothetical protein
VFVELSGMGSVVVLSMAGFYAFSVWSDERALSIYASTDGLGVFKGTRVALLTAFEREWTCSVARLVLLEGDSRR